MRSLPALGYALESLRQLASNPFSLRYLFNGRCRMHGGLSTGAKTQEGKDKNRKAARLGMLAYWAKKREFIP